MAGIAGTIAYIIAGITGTVAVIFVMIICYLKREQLSKMGVIIKKKTKDNQYAKAFVMNLKREQLSNMGVISKKKTKDNQYAKAFVMNQG